MFISKFYYWISFALQFGLPFVFLLIMNSIVIHTLRTRSNLSENVVDEGQGEIQGQGQKGGKIKTSERQLYLILLLVTFAFLILTTPAYVFFLVNRPVDFTSSPEYLAGLHLFNHVVQKLQFTNYGINICLYVISGQKFRRDLLVMLRIQKV